MNAVVLSPHFPPQYFQFATALRSRGVNVLGIGEAPLNELSGELRGALTEYCHVRTLEHYDDVYRALAYLISRHGRIDLVESHTEHWLPLEARLREDFNVPGPRPREVAYRRSKSGMAELFGKASVQSILGQKYESPEQLRTFIKQYGYPIVLKPDTGVGAARTYIVQNDAQLEEAMKGSLEGYLKQRYIQGQLYSYDGLVDGEGRIVFSTAHWFSSGIAEVVRDQTDLAYYSLREIPPPLETAGKRVVDAFDIRRRFFHIELFKLPSGDWCALEVNMRPPGGYTTDLMNYSADVDVYGMWADVVTGKQLPTPGPERKYFSGHAGRRWSRQYTLHHDELVRKLGPALLLHTHVPRAFAAVMSDEAYLFRCATEAELQEVLRLIHG